jgi:hypothetical protein
MHDGPGYYPSGPGACDWACVRDESTGKEMNRSPNVADIRCGFNSRRGRKPLADVEQTSSGQSDSDAATKSAEKTVSRCPGFLVSWCWYATSKSVETTTIDSAPRPPGGR